MISNFRIEIRKLLKMESEEQLENDGDIEEESDTENDGNFKWIFKIIFYSSLPI